MADLAQTLSGADGLDRSSPIPLYLQIKRQLQRRLAQWTADRFYSDDELCRLFGVSRMTVRQAVGELVEAGWLTRAKGLGTFVAPKRLEERPLAGVFDRPSLSGESVELLVARFERRACPDEIAAVLDLEPGSPTLYVHRVRSHRGVPVISDHRFLPERTARGLKRGDVARHSLVELIGRRCKIGRADMQMEAMAAHGADAAVLDAIPGDPVLVRRLVYRGPDGRALLAGHSVYRSDIIRYSISVPYDQLARRPSGAAPRTRKRENRP